MIFTIITYVGLQKKRLRVENAFSQIKIQSGRKADLVPYLADVAKSSTESANYLQLQNELATLEKAISVSRGFYNDAVMIYNRAIQTFPKNIVAKIFKFKKAEFFNPDEAVAPSIVKGRKCPSCGAVSTSDFCGHCGTRIPLM